MERLKNFIIKLLFFGLAVIFLAFPGKVFAVCDYFTGVCDDDCECGAIQGWVCLTCDYSKPDDSGCPPNTHLGKCWYTTARGVIKYDQTCCPCDTLRPPTNLKVSPVSDTELLVEWTPPEAGQEPPEGYEEQPSPVRQYVQWTNDPEGYGNCEINASTNPCQHNPYPGLPHDASSYLITDYEPGTTYYIQVDARNGLVGGCPEEQYFIWTFYPPTCQAEPDYLIIAPGETEQIELTSYGEVDEVRFVAPYNQRFKIETGDESEYFRTTDYMASDTEAPYIANITGLKTGDSIRVEITSYLNNPKYDPLHPQWNEPLLPACFDQVWVLVSEETEPPESDAWFQVADGNVHSTGSVVDRIPSTCTGSCVPNLITGTSGLVSYLDTLALGSGGVNETGADWHAETVYRDTQTGYAYFKRLLADDPAGINNWPDGTLPDDSGIYLHEGNISTEGVWEVVDGEHLILLVDGSVNVAANITAAKGGFLAIIASGDITISPEVTDVAGVFIADGAIHTGSATTQLVAQGIFTGWSGFYLERNLADNTATPAELFIYRPDLQLNAYKYLTWLDIAWHEVAP